MNSLGTLFRVTSFGESHGSHVGCVIDMCPAGIELNLSAIQNQVNRRRTKLTSFSSQRMEEDEVQIISGLFENKTTGSPITILIKNNDARSKDYNELKHIYRPNHADYTYQIKYGHRDYRGGGRSSIRITAPLVAAGEIALQLINTSFPVQTKAFVTQIGKIKLENKHQYQHLQFDQIDNNEVRCPDESTAEKMLQHIEDIRTSGDTIGGMVSCVIRNAPAGFGEPIFSKLQAELAHAMLSINSVKGFEYGYGFDSSAMLGSKYNDEFVVNGDSISTKTNHSGGIQGGISNGRDIYFHVAFKPISSIQTKQQSVNTNMEKVEFNIQGRHDVCAVPRAVPIVEAYTNIVLANAFLHSKLSSI